MKEKKQSKDKPKSIRLIVQDGIIEPKQEVKNNG